MVSQSQHLIFLAREIIVSDASKLNKINTEAEA